MKNENFLSANNRRLRAIAAPVSQEQETDAFVAELPMQDDSPYLFHSALALEQSSFEQAHHDGAQLSLSQLHVDNSRTQQDSQWPINPFFELSSQAFNALHMAQKLSASGEQASQNIGTGASHALHKTTASNPASSDNHLELTVHDDSGRDTGDSAPTVGDHALGSMIVKYKSGINMDALAEQSWMQNITVSKTWALTGAQLWNFSDDISVASMVEQCLATGLFEYATPDYIVRPSSLPTPPNDPLYGNLWGLDNSSDTDIDAPEAWQLTQGSSSMIVAVLDTGVDYTHPDLANNIWINSNEIAGDGIDNDGNGYIDDVRGWDFADNDNAPNDVYGHGTHVAGTIAASGNNGVGVIGVAPNVKIMCLKIIDDSMNLTTSNAISAINYAVSNGAAISNNSWGGTIFNQGLHDAIQTAGNVGHLFIAGAGNNALDTDINPFYPSSLNLNNVITVAASTITDSRASFSNYGPQSVDLAAPGEDIYSTLPGGLYGLMSGTSMAAPHVAGAAALLWSLYPTLNYQQVKDVLLGTVDVTAAFTGITVTDGRLNVAQAVHAQLGTAGGDELLIPALGIGKFAFGFDGDDDLTGNAADNTLFGGAGADTMSGGAGNDTYVVDDVGDVVTENFNEGLDSVQTSIHYTLTLNVENLKLMGHAAINGVGNALDNILTGNTSGNMLDGGAGADTLLGAKGNDTLSGAEGDDLLEGGEGDDTLIGGYGNDTLVCGSEFDRVLYTDEAIAYQISGFGQYWVVSDSTDDGADDGVDDLHNVEEIVFSNAVLRTNSYSETKVNTTDFNDQSLSATTGLSDGGYVVCWQSNGQDGSGTGIYAQRYNARGKSQGTEFQVNSCIAEYQSIPNVTALADGGFLVCWQSYEQDGSYEGIYAQRYSSSGQLHGAEFQVNTNNFHQQVAPSSAGLADGGFLVCWQSVDQDGSGAGIYAQRYNSAGQMQGTEFRVNSHTSSDQAAPSITALVDGGFVVCWQSNGQDGSSVGIYAQRYNSAGLVEGPEFLVNTFTIGMQLSCSITALSDGGFVACWASLSQDPDGFGIYAQRYNAAGQMQGTEFRVNSHTSSDQTAPSITALVDGGFVVCWQSNGQDGSGVGIYAQCYNAVGEAAGSEFLVNTHTTTHQTNSSIAALADGGFVISWTSGIQDGSGSGIYAQRFSATGQKWSRAVLEFGTTSDLVNTCDAYVSAGGGGDDTYLVNTYSLLMPQNILELTGDGIDTVQASVNYSLGENLENLTLVGSTAVHGTGNSLNNHLIGNARSNILRGGAGHDTLNGSGGIDTLIGGNGNDTYWVDTAADIVIENLNAGKDHVFSSVNYTLNTHIENLTLVGATAINCTGNILNNRLTGNTLANTLNGAGGADTLIGGAGNDSYLMNDIGIIIIENTNEGIDTVYSSMDCSLSANVENLNLIGNNMINGVGNSLDNMLVGNYLSNRLNGGSGNDTMDGGGGLDILIGGLGNDTFIVNDLGDTIIENLNGGIDTTITTINYVLDAHVENLKLAGINSINGSGNNLNNIIIGNHRDNIICGNHGNDTLTGGFGADIFVFDTVVNLQNIDAIIDFNQGDGDRIALESTIFKNLTGLLNLQDHFRLLTDTPTGGDDYIVYDNTSGNLYYDANGNGTGSLENFALLINKPNLIAGGDFIIF